MELSNLKDEIPEKIENLLYYTPKKGEKELKRYLEKTKKQLDPIKNIKEIQ
jgi:hypothetical protein